MIQSIGIKESFVKMSMWATQVYGCYAPLSISRTVSRSLLHYMFCSSPHCLRGSAYQTILRYTLSSPYVVLLDLIWFVETIMTTLCACAYSCCIVIGNLHCSVFVLFFPVFLGDNEIEVTGTSDSDNTKRVLKYKKAMIATGSEFVC